MAVAAATSGYMCASSLLKLLRKLNVISCDRYVMEMSRLQMRQMSKDIEQEMRGHSARGKCSYTLIVGEAVDL